MRTAILGSALQAADHGGELVVARPFDAIRLVVSGRVEPKVDRASPRYLRDRDQEAALQFRRVGGDRVDLGGRVARGDVPRSNSGSRSTTRSYRRPSQRGRRTVRPSWIAAAVIEASAAAPFWLGVRWSTSRPYVPSCALIAKSVPNM